MLKQLPLPFSTPITSVSEIQLIYKTKVKAKDRPKICSSQDAYDILKECFDKNTIELKEEFKILVLNRSNNVLGHLTISSGTTSGALVDIKFIVTAASRTNASGVILSHNHPSGNLKPSHADLKMTKKIIDALKLIDVAVLDHIIMTSDSHTSMADEGII